MQGKTGRALGPRGGAAQGNLKTVGGWGEGEYVGTKIRARSVQPWLYWAVVGLPGQEAFFFFSSFIHFIILFFFFPKEAF